jgi:hypothetical protein
VREVQPPLLERVPTPVLWTFVLAAAAIFWIVVAILVATLLHLG